jgi:bifunctional UDP-N-acetylglucosamine pyrophosphorylase / glucosamine-1-phosphate N-acetyltransferase
MPVAVSAVVVLAAGAGTRMKSSLPKVMHPMAGHPLVWHALRAAEELHPQHLVAVIGHGREAVGSYLAGALPHVRTAIQDQQLGTGHAVGCALDEIGSVSGTVVVTYGDVPLLRSETLQELAEAHAAAGNAVTVLTAVVGDPTGYGRIVRDAEGSLAAIVEHKDADPTQRAITEINSGVYAFDAAVLQAGLARLTSSNAQGERYLTDIVGMARSDGGRVGTLVAADPMETEGVNDRVQLASLARVLNARIVRAAQLSGVTVIDPETTWIHADVQIAPDALIERNTSLESGSVIGAGAVIGPDTTLIGCTVGADATVLRSHAQRAMIGERASVGPFSFLRPGAELAAGAKVGAYVEVKQSSIGRNSKVPHLSYVGDTTIGDDVNFSAGAITANYDGENKFRTTIGDGAFVGTHTTLVAPVTVASGAFIAAGSVITADVQPGDLAIGRSRQTAIPGWVLTRKPTSSIAEAARSARAADGTVDAPQPAADGSGNGVETGDGTSAL